MRVLRILMVVLLAALPAWGAEPLGEKVAALLRDLTGEDRTRQGAARAGFRALGPAAIPHTIAHIGELDERQLEAVLEAYQAVGVEQSLAALLAHRSAWPLSPKHTERIEAVVRRLRGLRPPSDTSRVALLPAKFTEWQRIPPWAERRIDSKLPVDLAGGDYVAEPRKQHLAVDTRGDGRAETLIKAGKARRIELGPRGKARALLVYEKVGSWFAASAAVIQGKVKKARVQVLDADLDGRFDGERDAVRWDDGAFRRNRPEGLVQTRAGLLRYRIEHGPSDIAVSYAQEPLPSDASPPLLDALAALNDWRNTIGLPALRPDLPRSRACRLHCDYWARHGYSGHEEIPGGPGYTEEGAEAGRNSSVWPSTPLSALCDWARDTVLHRISVVGGGPIGLAGAQDPGSCVWTDRPSAAFVGDPILVPAPGQRAVPTACRKENPPPDRNPDFYHSQRGYPIAAFLLGGEHGLEDATVDLIELGRKRRPVDGDVFTPKRPYTRIIPNNYRAVHFVPAVTLKGRQWYAVRVRATHGDGAQQELAWQFLTR